MLLMRNNAMNIFSYKIIGNHSQGWRGTCLSETVIHPFLNSPAERCYLFEHVETGKKCWGLLDFIEQIGWGNVSEMELGSRDNIVTKADIEPTLMRFSF